MRTFSTSRKFEGCTRVTDWSSGGASVVTPWGAVDLAPNGRVVRMEFWHLVDDAARGLNWRRSHGGPETFGDVQYFWENDVPVWDVSMQRESSRRCDWS